MSYGIFQEYYTSNWPLRGGPSATGVIGTTFNGVIYIAMPFLFAPLTQRWAHFRRTIALCGIALTCLSFLLSSFSTVAWQVVATQGVLAPLGCALIYSPTTLSLGEWYADSHRAVAYGIVLSSKNIVGTACPFLLRYLLDRYSFRTAMRVWTAIAAGVSLCAIFMIPNRPPNLSSLETRRRRIPWNFLRHQTFYVWTVAIIMQSAGYGIPQTYLSSYAHETASLSQTSATLLLTLFNVPGIVSSCFFGFLNDNKRFHLSATTTTCISALSSTLSALLLWGLASPKSLALLALFSIIFGFFAGGYSATWGGVINEMERESAERNEAIDTGILYGLLNGARGIGYVSGGVAGVFLLKTGSPIGLASLGYGTEYFALILFTGLSSVFGGWSVLWRWKKLFH